ncbi:hypothetical protein FBU30_004005 [Linnemannia zychae]|nr:hypothetical protein FBU30_004005 [Linnemannia zychae]
MAYVNSTKTAELIIDSSFNNLSILANNNFSLATPGLPTAARAQILPMRLPPFRRRLPVSSIVLLSYQQPPQHWDRSTLLKMMQRKDLSQIEQFQIQQLFTEEHWKHNNEVEDENSDDDKYEQDITKKEKNGIGY